MALPKHHGLAIDKIIIHCSATRPTWYAKKPVKAVVNEIRRWHVEENGWDDIAYHYVIHRDGNGTDGRPLELPGAHTRGQNIGSIGIVLIGGHGSTSNDLFSVNFTSEQESALIDQINRLNDLNGGPLKIQGHNQYANKACPGFNVPHWFASVKDRIRMVPTSGATLTPVPVPKPTPKPTILSAPTPVLRPAPKRSAWARFLNYIFG